MKLFYLILLSMFAASTVGSASLIVNSDIENAMDIDEPIQVHDSQLEVLGVVDHENDFDAVDKKTEEEGEQTAEVKHPFNIDRFLNELDVYDCDKVKAGTAHLGESEREFNQICATALEETTFKPMGNFDADSEEFYTYLSNNVYKPLAYHVEKKDALSDVLKDLIFIEDNKSLIGKEMPLQTYSDFEDGILGEFRKIENMTNDMDSNHGSISDIVIQLLKRFHIYWNTLRSKNQIDKAKVDTKELMRGILEEYQTKEKSLYEVTQTLASQVKEAYFRFLKAHQSIKLLGIEGPNVIAKRVLERFRSAIDALKAKKASNPQFIKELTLITDLQQAYYIMNHKNKLTEPQNMHNFAVNVMNKIPPLYNEYIESLPDADERRKTLKHFTAVLLLKMKHKEHLIFRYHGTPAFTNFNRNIIQSLSSVSVKVYYDLFNSLIVVPKSCINTDMLKECVYAEINKALKEVAGRYNLKRSTGGWNTFSYVSDIVQQLIKKSKDDVYSKWSSFKAYYYQNLFGVMQNIKEHFLIEDMDCLEDLESGIGETIEKFKKDNAALHLDFDLINQFDNYIYKVLLNIKADYHTYSNISNDPAMLMQVQNRVYNELLGFERQNSSSIGQDFIDLVKHVRETTEEWRIHVINSSEPPIIAEAAVMLTGDKLTLPIGMASIDSSHNLGSIYNYRNIETNKVIDDQNQRLAEALLTQGTGPSVPRSTTSVASVIQQTTSQEAGNAPAGLQTADFTQKPLDEEKKARVLPLEQQPAEPAKTEEIKTPETSTAVPDRQLNDENEGKHHDEDSFGKPTVSYDEINLIDVTPDDVNAAQVSEHDEEEIIVRPKERFPITPQHEVMSNSGSNNQDVSLESGFTDSDIIA